MSHMCSSIRSHVLPLLLVIALLCSLSPSLKAEAAGSVRQVVKLGFLLPYPKADNVIPVRLADEWIAASRVALEVLGPKYSDAFDVVPHIANSNCDREEAKEAAQLLLRDGVVGVVGPACTEAALGAADVLVPAGVPIVSHQAAAMHSLLQELVFERVMLFFTEDTYGTAAMHSLLQDFGDRHQAAAMRSLLQEFVFDRVILFFTEDTYGTALGYDIEYFARSDNLTVQSIPVPVPCSNYSSLFLNLSNPSPTKPFIQADDSTVVVLAVSPNAAEGIWQAALDLGRLEYPWWYFGTDGAVAFDLVGEGQNLSALATALQGEMGVAPYKGDYSDSSPIWEYIMHWRTKRHDIYPGLLTLDVGPSLPRFNTTRQYVPYLFDAVHSFFEAFSSIIANQNSAPTKELVLACFKGVPRGCINFTGTTGQVSFNPATGERLKTVAPPTYSIVNLEGVTWQQKARWEERHVERFTLDLSQISRPGPLPDAAGAGGSSGGSGGGSGGGGGGAGNGSAGGVKEAGDYSAPAAFDALNQVSGEIGDFGVKSQAPDQGEAAGNGSSGSSSSSGGSTGGSNNGTSPSTGSSMPGYTIALLVLLSLTLLCLVSYLAFMGYSSWRSREKERGGQQQLYGGSSGGDVYLAGFKGGEVGGEEYVRSTRAVRIVAMAQPDLKKEIQEKIAAAQETCSDPNSTAECAAAWDEVEEISAAAADQALKQKQADYEDPLEKYCNENPSEDECRIYSD
ncbi:unnamed protein product [Closterium sp. Yama58-4]|nr:unnamed protein product [Closterium sp. Yama58-4]